MNQLNKSLRRHTKTIFITFSSFATAKRSYYDILDLQPNCSHKQLRKKFLEKARLYHPDHNSSKQALQEFKLLKEAYQTLKDPQKKHMYDSGISQTSDDIAPVHNQQVKEGRKYYENKWYGFQKPKQQDTRDQYYQAKAQFFQQKPPNHLRYVMTFTAIILGIFGYDLIANRDSDRSKRIQEVKKVVDDSVSSASRQTKKQMMMQRYIERRAEVNKVTDLD